MNNINKAAITATTLALLLTGCSQQQVSGSSQVAGSSQQVAGSSQQVAGSSQQAAGSSQQVAGSSQQQASSQQQQAAPVEPTDPKPPVVVVTPPPRPQSGHVHPAIANCTKSVRHNHRSGNTQHQHKYSCRGQRPTPPRRPVHVSGHTHPAIANCTKSVRHNHKSGKRPHNHKYSCQKARPRTQNCTPCRPAYRAPVRRPAVRRAPVRRPAVHRAPVRRPAYRAPVRRPVAYRAPVRRPAGNRWTHSHPAIPNCTKSIRHTHQYGNRNHKHAYGCRGRAPAHRPAPHRATGGNRWTHSHPAIPNCTKSIRHTHQYGTRNHKHAYGCRGRAPAHRSAVVNRPPAAKNSNRVNIPALQRKLKAKGYYKGPINGVVNPATRSALHRYQQNR